MLVTFLFSPVIIAHGLYKNLQQHCTRLDKDLKSQSHDNSKSNKFKLYFNIFHFSCELSPNPHYIDPYTFFHAS